MTIVRLAVALMLLSSMGCKQYDASGAARPASIPVLIYADSFEVDSGWQMFEEIVGSNPCYAADIGSVERSTDHAFDGMYSLLVWANKTKTAKSNHVIAHKRVLDHGDLGIWRYRIHAYVPSESVNRGQTGPELSMQNTRSTGNGATTSIAGVQYIANPTWETGWWKLWNNGQWTTVLTESLKFDTWYTLTLEADFTSGRYRSFVIDGDGHIRASDVSSYTVAEEARGFSPAFEITLEGENLWNNCGTVGSFDYKVHYDMISLTQDVVRSYLPFTHRA